MNRSEASKILAVLRSVYSDQINDPDLDMVWTMVFDDVSYENVMVAIQHYLKGSSPYFPKPGEIRAVLVEHLLGLPSAEEAWGMVMREVRNVGSYGNPDFTQLWPLFQAVRAIGWREICLSENIGIERAHFMRTYQSYRERSVREVDLAALTAGGERAKSLADGPAREWWESDSSEVAD